MGGAGGGAAAGGMLAAEICMPLLLLCWLCCWPDDSKSDSTTGRHPQRPVLAHVHESGNRRRSSDFFGRRIGSSAVSLHLPSTSGYKKPLSAHRSHEEIGRRKSHVETNDQETRYHSAPSVIDEVLHRRDWERSKQDLYIPLKPEVERESNCSSASSESLDKAPHAEPESSSIEEYKSDERIVGKSCKKHHTNIKSSRGKKEKQSSDIKDADELDIAGEASSFYIGESQETNTAIKHVAEEHKAVEVNDVHTKSIYKAKDAKQTFNESIKSKDRPRQTLAPLDEHHPRTLGFCLNDVIDQLDTLDRSGATHHSMESRISLSNRPVFPPPSVEPVSYEGGACYLVESGWVAELRGRGGAGAGAGGGPRAVGAHVPGAADRVGLVRGRHASDGDILAPHHRPESGAFSESDLDLELEGAEEVPPPYEELHRYSTSNRKETAI